ncbi:hypothetical protein [Lysinibacillus sphaericus]|uniref:hypothetical protein n=1 Tax=Lysinibacillus sphaericus TaxID=1421 RepID=UPI001C8D1178|nr:hypothetical protein [Lysinibacillus sp. SDF0037]
MHPIKVHLYLASMEKVCKGKGHVTLDLAYMGDVDQVCEKCYGKRYNDEVLSVKWKGLSIHDVLQLTPLDAKGFFSDQGIQRFMANLIMANLGYIHLDQSLDTFSGGELQRVKMAKILGDPSNDLIVLEHNLSIMSQAQWIVDMGIEGGNLGGNVLFEGYPIDLLDIENSYTAKHLRRYVKAT